MSALRLVLPGPSNAPRKGETFTRLRNRPVAIRKPILITCQDSRVEFHEWCETTLVGADSCKVRTERPYPRGALLRLDIPNMKMQETGLPGGARVCQWECTPRGTLARVAGSVAVHGKISYWVTELQFSRAAAKPPVPVTIGTGE